MADLDTLYLAPDLNQKLVASGVTSVQDLVVDNLAEMLEGYGLNEEETSAVQVALDSMFSNKPESKTDSILS